MENQERIPPSTEVDEVVEEEAVETDVAEEVDEVDQEPEKPVYDPERSLDEQLEEYFANLESEEQEEVENDEGEGEPASEEYPPAEDPPAESPPAAEPTPSQNAELEMYRRLFEDADAYAKDAMFGSMIEMIAEAKGVSVEEYRSSLGLIEPSNSQLISLKAKEDIDAINRRFPDAKISSLEDIKNTSKYVALRDEGVSAEEAYAQVIQPKEDGKKHMTATASKTTPSRGAQMTAFEKRAARDLFPGMSDAEIQKLYKRVSK